MKKILLILAILPLLLNAQQKEAKVAFSGYKGNYIYNLFKPASLQHPDGEVTGFRLDRKKRGEEAWKTLQTLSTPASLEELERNVARAKTTVFEYREETAYSVNEVWPVYKEHFNYDSLGVYLTQQHLALAFGVLLVDTTAVATENYQYRVVQLKRDGTEAGKYISLPVSSASFTAPAPKSIARSTSGGSFTMVFAAKKGTEPVEAILVKRKTAGGRAFARIVPYYTIETSADSTIFTVVDDQIGADELYSYTITPLNRFGGGTSSFSDTLHITNIEEKLLLPKAFTAKADSVRKCITLDWAFLNPDVIAVTKVYRSTAYENGYEYIGSSALGNFTDKTAVPGTKYYYYLTITDKMGRASEPGMKVYALMQDGAKHRAPMYVSLKAADKTVTVEWQDFDLATRGFKVYRTNGIGAELYPISNFIPAVKSSEGRYSFTDADRPGGTIGYAVVSESLSNVLSDFSNIQYLKKNDAAPMAPSITEVSMDKNNVRIFWTRPNDSTYNTVGYNLLRQEGKGAFVKMNKGIISIAKSSFTDTSRIAGASYSYKMQAISGDGKTIDSDPYELSIATITGAPGTLKSFLDEQASLVLLEWQPAQGDISKYEIYRFSRGTDPSKIAEVDQRTLQYRDAIKQKDKTVYYFVVAVNKSGQSSVPSNEAYQRLSAVAGQ